MENELKGASPCTLILGELRETGSVQENKTGVAS